MNINSRPASRSDRPADPAEEYISREAPRKKTGDEIESLLRREIIPAIGDKVLTEIRRRDAVRLLDALVDGGRPGTALKAHWVVKRVFNWAVMRDEIDASHGRATGIHSA